MQLWQEVAMWATIAGVPVLMAAYFRGALRAWRFADAYLPRENRLLLVLAGILSLSAVAQYLALRLTPVASSSLETPHLALHQGGISEAEKDLIADIPVSDECQVDVTWTPGSDVGRIYGRSIADGFLRGGWLVRAYSPTRFEPPEFRGIRLIAKPGDTMADAVAAMLGRFARIIRMPSEGKLPCHLEVWIGTRWAGVGDD